MPYNPTSERYHVCDADSMLDTAKTFDQAKAKATRIPFATIFDVMARRGKTQQWIFENGRQVATVNRPA